MGLSAKKSLLLSLLFLIFPFTNTFPLFTIVNNIDDTEIKRIIISPLNKDIFYAASQNALYKSDDGGESFTKISVFKDEEIKHLLFDPYLGDTLYLATARHIYKVTTEKTEEIFSATEETTIISVGKYKGEIFAGTTQGLYSAGEELLNWQKIKGIGDEEIVYYIEQDKENLYLVTSRGVYSFIDKENIQRKFVIRQQEEEGGLTANVLKIDVFDKNTLWLGTNRGLYASYDKGDSFKKLSIDGVNNLYIYSIFQTELEKESIYLGTAKGLFRADWKTKKSRQIFEGISSSKILWGEFAQGGKIYLATGNGLFKSEYFTSPSSQKSIEEVLEKEPDIEEIQEAVLRYNEVHPDKIKKWRRALKFKALFPDVRVDYDKTIDIYQTTTTQRVLLGPRDWGLNFSWDVGELIWNSSEDDIDTRSRLNTQLRLDILDEINRVYFERLRLKREILTSSFPEEESFQKKLRLKELTAILNGYTGGYYSRRLKELGGK